MGKFVGNAHGFSNVLVWKLSKTTYFQFKREINEFHKFNFFIFPIKEKFTLVDSSYKRSLSICPSIFVDRVIW